MGGCGGHGVNRDPDEIRVRRPAPEESAMDDDDMGFGGIGKKGKKNKRSRGGDDEDYGYTVRGLAGDD